MNTKMKLRRIKSIYIPESYIHVEYSYLIDFKTDFPQDKEDDCYVCCEWTIYVFDYEHNICYFFNLK